MHKPSEKVRITSLEVETICLLLKIDLTISQKKKLETNIEIIDWKKFASLTMKHRVYGLVSQSLAKYHVSDNNQMIEYVKTQYKKDKLRTLDQMKDFLDLIDSLEKVKINFLSIKGLPLAKELYEDISLRHSKDIDILVDEKDLRQVESELLLLEYHEVELIKEESEFKRKHILDKRRHSTYVNHKGTNIEVHWRLMEDCYALRFDETIGRQRTIKLMQSEIHVLSVEENIIYLLIHGSRHIFNRIKWLYDLYLIMQKVEVDWQLLRKRILSLQIAYMWEQMCILLEIYFDYTEIPDMGFDRHQKNLGEKLVKVNICFIESDYEYPVERQHPLVNSAIYYQWIWQDTARRKIRLIQGLIKPGNADFDTWDIESRYHFLYYVLRPFRLVQTYGLKPIKRKILFIIKKIDKN